MIIGKKPIDDAVRGLNTHPIRAVVSVTGGGVGIVPQLWAAGGMSGTLLDAGCPYHRIALSDTLDGAEDDTKCRPETAVRMAVAAYEWAEEITQRDKDLHGVPIVGLGITAALAKEPARSRPDWFHAAALGPKGLKRVDATFEQGSLDRLQQGQWTDLAGISLLLDAAGLETVSFRRPWGVTCNQLGPEDFGIQRMIPSGDGDRFTLDSETFWNRPLHLADGTRGAANDLDSAKHILFPGSFNPVHYAHIQSAKTVERQTGKEVVWAITATHPIKGNIPLDELIRRRMQFRWRYPLLFTRNDGLFLEKALAFPGFSFLIGADVMLGILDPKYYGGENDRDVMLQEFQRIGTRFYVTGCTIKERGYTRHEDIPVPFRFKKLFEGVQGRWDIRSSDLR